MATPHRDRTLFAWLVGLVLLMIVAVSIFAPSRASHDQRPSTNNPAPGGAKAAFLLLQSLHQPVARWDRPLDDLQGIDAARTTLVLASPLYSALEKDRLAAALRRFLDRGGRVLTTGDSGALLIPGGATKGSRRFGALCFTEPQGPGPLAAAADKVEIFDTVRWADDSPAVRVEQRCGPDAVVIREPIGRGEAIWWSSPAPLTNAELRNDPDLKLLLASLGPGRTVLFDEALQQPVRSRWSAAAGLPLLWLLGQAGLVFGLLVFSFSRRRGPIRLPVAVPRSSPVEFAISMGDLYERAGATGAATGAARRRLERVLIREGGLPQRTVEQGPEAVATSLHQRFGGSWTSLAEHLREAAASADVELKPRSALALVRALGEDAEHIRRAAHPEKLRPQPRWSANHMETHENKEFARKFLHIRNLPPVSRATANKTRNLLP